MSIDIELARKIANRQIDRYNDIAYEEYQAAQNIHALADEVDRLEKHRKEMALLLIEARDALPAISMVAAKLHHVDLTLADRIEKTLEPWRLPEEEPKL